MSVWKLEGLHLLRVQRELRVGNVLDLASFVHVLLRPGLIGGLPMQPLCVCVLFFSILLFPSLR